MTETRTAKAEATRQRILDVALTRFAEKGFAETTMREIAAEAGCSLGLAYRYFATKDAMVLALYESLVDEFTDAAAKLGPGTLAQRWAQAMRGDFARLQRNRKALMGLTSAGLAHGSDTQVLGPAAAGLRQRMLAIFSRIVNESKDAPKGQLAESLVSLLYALHLQLVLFWLQDPTENQKATSELIEVGEDGLGALRLAIRLPWVSGPLVKIAAVLTPILYGK